jgi:hypothetical protein
MGKILSRDTAAAAEAVQIELLRKASVSRRLALASSLSTTVIQLSRRAIARRHPEASDRDVLLMWVGIHYGPDLARRVQAHLKHQESTSKQ